jgi:glycosyltransferase involved in cell wall biosynthesis
MNFLLVVDSLLGGGAERMVLTLAKAMSSLGHVAIVYNLSGDCELKTPKGVMVIDGDFKIAAREAYRYRRKFNRSISDIESQIGKFDGIVGNLPLSEAFLHHASRDAVFVIHCVLSHHLYSGRGLLKRRRKRSRSQQRYKHRRLICCSNGVRDDLIENFSIRPEQCVTIYNPIDVQWVRQQASAPLTDDLPSGDYLLHVGSFSKVKRHDLLLEAYALSGVPGDLNLSQLVALWVKWALLIKSIS